MKCKIVAEKILRKNIDVNQYKKFAKQLQKESSAEKGNLLYRIVYNDAERRVTFFEIWESEEYVKSIHIPTKHVQEIVPKMKGFYEEEVFETWEEIKEEEVEKILRNIDVKSNM